MEVAGGAVGTRSVPGGMDAASERSRRRPGTTDAGTPAAGVQMRRRSEKIGRMPRSAVRIMPVPLHCVTWSICRTERACEPVRNSATELGVIGMALTVATSTLPRRSTVRKGWLARRRRRRPGTPGPSDGRPPPLHTATTHRYGGVWRGATGGGGSPPGERQVSYGYQERRLDGLRSTTASFARMPFECHAGFAVLGVVAVP